MIKTSKIKFHDLEPERETFFQDVCVGLSKQQKSLPCKYLYNKIGSNLFNAICKTKEYYLTRTELEIMRNHVKEMTLMMGPHCLFIEYGSGNGKKIRLLLDHLEKPAGYVPIDISKEHLKQTVHDLNKSFSKLEILAVCADFTGNFELPTPQTSLRQKVVYFPGSTIGNFSQTQSLALLKKMKKFLTKNDGLLIGIDLKKDEEILNRAYNDHSGLTAGFNRNILLRINHELEGTFRLEWFDHKAFYNAKKNRMEMHLSSRREHTVSVLKNKFNFHKGETIHTESSYKYTIDEFSQLAHLANFKLKKYWLDKNKFFGVLYFTL